MRRPLRFLGSLLILVASLSACGDDEPGAEATTAELLSWAEGRVDDADLDRAITGYRRVLQRDSLHVEALVQLARIYDRQGRPDPADRYRRRAFHGQYNQAVAHVEADRPDSAYPYLRRAVGVMPKHPMAHLLLGDLERRAGRLDSAIVHYQTAVEANPRFAESLMKLGDSYLEAERFDDAKSAFERAIAANINSLDAYLGLGAILSKEGEWAGAIENFEKALLINPRSAPARDGLERARDRLRGRS